MARKFDLGVAIVAGLVIFVVLAGSGCLDENPIDTASDDTLEDITDGEMTDASGTMDATLFKMAEEASGGYEPVAVAEKVQIEVLDDGSVAPYDIDNLPENLPADVALDAYTHPEKYFSIVELPNGNLKIVGLQELDGWKITRSYEGKTQYNSKPLNIHKTDLNNDIFGDVVMKTSYSEENGNPSGNEITAVLAKDPKNGHVRAYVFLSPEWTNEENYRIVHQPSGCPWKFEMHIQNVCFQPYHIGMFEIIHVNDCEIPYIIHDLTHTEENLDYLNHIEINYRPTTFCPCIGEKDGDIIHYDEIPGISIERTS